MADAILAVISREDAKQQGLKRYFTGLPCMHGHIAPRNVGRNNECVACKAVRDLDYCARSKAAKAEYDKEYRRRNRDSLAIASAEYRANNRERIVANSKAYYAENADLFKAYRAENKSKRNAQKRAWHAANKKSVAAYARDYNRTKMKENGPYRIAALLRQRLAMAVRDGAKSGSAVRDLGCSISDLKKHIESKFSDGMAWDNWGRSGWHIDHIKPLASFDLSNRDQIKQACHYSNLQPLWAKDNLSKGTRTDWIG